GGGGVEAAEGLGEGVVEGAQGVGAPEVVEEGGGLGGHLGEAWCVGFGVPSPRPLSRERERGSFAAPAKRVSTAATRSGLKVQAWTPGESGRVASRPRQNR